MLPSTPPHPTANPDERPLTAITPVELDTDVDAETPEERTSRHKRLCQEMIAHGMVLLRAASQRASQDIDPPHLEHPMPGSAATTIAQLRERIRQRVHQNAIVFARLTRAVRQTMALQALVAAGYPPPRAPQPPGQDRAPRTAATGQAPPRQPDAALRCDAPECPDWRPTLDADSRTPVEDLLHKIAQDIDQAHIQAPAPDAPPPNTAPRRAQPNRRPKAGAAPPAPSRRPPIRHNADG